MGFKDLDGYIDDQAGSVTPVVSIIGAGLAGAKPLCATG